MCSFLLFVLDQELIDVLARDAAVLKSSKNTQVLATLMRLTPDGEESSERESAKDQLARRWESLKNDLRR